MSKKSRRVAKARRVLLALSLVLATMLVTVGGTIAWLTAKTDEVVNTFSPTGIDIKLFETLYPDGSSNYAEEDTAKENPLPLVKNEWKAQLIPGMEYQKNPTVSVEDTTNVDIYLFVKFEENANESYLKYTSNLVEANEWNELESVDNVWWRIVRVNDTVKSWELIDDNKVTVDTSLTKESGVMPTTDWTLKYTAYASQLMKNNTTEFEPSEAWTNAQPVGQ